MAIIPLQFLWRYRLRLPISIDHIDDSTQCCFPELYGDCGWSRFVVEMTKHSMQIIIKASVVIFLLYKILYDSSKDEVIMKQDKFANHKMFEKKSEMADSRVSSSYREIYFCVF